MFCLFWGKRVFNDTFYIFWIRHISVLFLVGNYVCPTISYCVLNIFGHWQQNRQTCVNLTLDARIPLPPIHRGRLPHNYRPTIRFVCPPPFTVPLMSDVWGKCVENARWNWLRLREDEIVDWTCLHVCVFPFCCWCEVSKAYNDPSVMFMSRKKKYSSLV